MPPSVRLAACFGAYFLYAGAFLPYFALYLAARGFGAVEIAAVMAMPQLARIAAPAFWGWLADRSGAGRAIVVGSGLALIAGYPLIGAAEGALAVALVALIVALVVRNLATAAGWLLGPGAVAYLVAMLIDWPWHVPAASATFAFILGALAGCGCAPGSAGRASARPSAS